MRVVTTDYITLQIQSTVRDLLLIKVNKTRIVNVIVIFVILLMG